MDSILGDTIVLQKDIVIPAGTKFLRVSNEADRYSSTVGLDTVDESCGDLTFKLNLDDPDTYSWFEDDGEQQPSVDTFDIEEEVDTDID